MPLFKQWFENEEKFDQAFDSLVQGLNLMMYFEKDGRYYGTTEEGRLSFALMKNPDKEVPDGWEEDANFTAYDLEKMLQGEPAQTIFTKKDISDIKVVSEDEVREKLNKKVKEDDIRLNVSYVSAANQDMLKGTYYD